MRDFLAVTKALGDETRVRALMALRDRELCLCQIIDLLGLAPSTVSKHMTLLQQAGLVERRKEGRWHFYRLAGATTAPHVRQVLDWALETMKKDPMITEDAQSLRRVCAKDREDLASCYRT
jgi:ArsR family transcriptional regulator